MTADTRYDTAAMKAYAANVAAFYRELRDQGMDRREAVAVTIALIQALIARPTE